MSDEILNESAIDKESTPTVENEQLPVQESIPPPKDTPVEETAQIPVSEPLPTQNSALETQKPEEITIPVNVPPKVESSKNKVEELLVTARNFLQIRKRKKLDKVMSMFTKETNITNDKVEKILHVSDATATRYLSILEKEGKIKKSQSKGRGVTYTKI